MMVLGARHASCGWSRLLGMVLYMPENFIISAIIILNFY
jgi:hypothetical protein